MELKKHRNKSTSVCASTPAFSIVYREGPNDQAEITDLFPLIFLNPQRHVYVFQSLKDENASYISSNENAITYISDALNEEIDTCFQNIIPSFDISRIKLGGTENLYGRRIHRIHEANLQRKEVQSGVVRRP